MLQRSLAVVCLCALFAACGDDDDAAAAGAGGKGGTAGKPAAVSGGGANEPPFDTGASVLERNKHPSRDGNFVQPTLTKAAVKMMARDTGFTASFSGDMWASPLYLENGPGDKGVFFAVTTGNDVLALDEETGAQVWKANLGAPAMRNGVSCGSIHPMGIVSTPVIDAGARTIFVAAAIGNANTILRHELHALNVDDGKSRSSWPFDVTTITSNAFRFTAPPQNQRSALSLVNGIVYVAYGGHVGDCGDYRGWVVGVDSKDPSKAGGWATLGIGEGIWAAGGMASDGESVFAITGNSTRGASMRASSDSEQVVRIKGLGTLDRNDKNLYFPAHWKSMDGVDADFGASSPLYLRIPGSTPENYVVAFAKDGHMYLLDSANLGGMGGHRVDFTVSSGAMSLRTTPAAYTTPNGIYVVFSTNAGAKCPNGNRDDAVMAVRIAPGSPPKPEVAWCAALSGGEPGPIATTTDGKSEAIVWFMNQGVLTAVDGDTGAALWNSGNDRCSGIRKWASPIAVKGRIVAGGDGHLCSWSVH